MEQADKLKQEARDIVPYLSQVFGQTGLSKQHRHDRHEHGIQSRSTQLATHPEVYPTNQEAVKQTYQDFRTSMVGSESVSILRVNMIV